MLRPYQEEGIARLVETKRHVLADEVGLGKAQPLDASILTPNGWKSMGEIIPGEQVIGSDGKPTKVIGTFPQGEKDIFRVTFRDGSSTECCDDHLWHVRKDFDHTRGPRERVISLREIRQKLFGSNERALHFIPMVQPVEFPSQDLPLHPYVLGVLLGDGGLAHRVQLTNSEEEITSKVESLLPVGVSLNQRSYNEFYICGEGPGKPNVVMDTLRSMGLHGVKSAQKFIPNEYLFAPIEDRRRMLAGLLDTDGTVSKQGYVEYNTVSRELADGVQFIVESLGGTARRRIKKTTHQDCHRIWISLPGGENPFYLTRKAEAYRPKTKYPPSRAIISVDYVGKKEAQCITVSAEDGLYVTNNCIVTHNSVQALEALRRLDCQTNLIVCPTFAIGVWESEIEKWWPGATVDVFAGIARYRNAAWADFCERDEPRFLVANYQGLVTLTDGGPKRFDGVIYDEAHALVNRSTKTFKAAKLIRSDAVFMLTGTPMRKLPGDFWAYLNLIDRTKFRSYWTFVREHCHVIKGDFGLEILNVRDADAFRAFLKQYILRRFKKDHLAELPEDIRQKVPVPMSPEFEAIYSEAAKDLIAEIGEDAFIASPNKVVQLLRLRQLLVAPSALGLEIDPPGMEPLLELTEQAFDNKDRVVVFTPFIEGVRTIAARIAKRFKCPTFEMHGEQDREVNQESVAAFQALPSDKPGALVATIGQSAAWSATNAATSIFLGFDWAPLANEQAEGRLHRHGQTKPVNHYYLYVRGTVEQHVIHILDQKATWESKSLYDTVLPEDEAVAA